MRVWLGIGAIVVVALVAARFLGFSPEFSVCSRNEEIAANERGEIVGAAERFLSLLNAGDADGARNAMSDEARAATELSGLESAVVAVRNPGGGPGVLGEVFKLYAPLGSREGMSLCGSPSRPALVSRHGGTNVALVTIEQPLVGGEQTWTIYFERERDAWRVRHFYFAPSAIDQRDGDAFRTLARSQAQAGNSFNATILYDISKLLLARGESFVPSEAYGLADERGERHADLAGSAPFTFRLGDEQFNVSLLNVSGTTDGSLVLLLEQMGEPPGDRALAIARNRAFIEAMNEHRPEWREAFDALVTAYPTGESRLWRTVYERDDGYSLTAEEELASES